MTNPGSAFDRMDQAVKEAMRKGLQIIESSRRGNGSRVDQQQVNGWVVETVVVLLGQVLDLASEVDELRMKVQRLQEGPPR